MIYNFLFGSIMVLQCWHIVFNTYVLHILIRSKDWLPGRWFTRTFDANFIASCLLLFFYSSNFTRYHPNEWKSIGSRNLFFDFWCDWILNKRRNAKMSLKRTLSRSKKIFDTIYTTTWKSFPVKNNLMEREIFHKYGDAFNTSSLFLLTTL